MPTQQQVLDAFDALGGRFNHVQALKARLVQGGFNVAVAAEAVEAALAAGVLVMDSQGGIQKS